MRLTTCLLMVVVAGCAHKGAGPRQLMLSLNGHLAKYRDWKGADVCGTDPVVLKKELTAMDDLLLEFVTQTSGGAQGTWTNEQIALLEEGVRELPPAIDATNGLLTAMGRCKFPTTTGLADPKRKGDELTVQARANIDKAPELIPLLKAKVVLTKWKTEQAAAIDTARGEWCGPKPKPGTVPDIYYAIEDETGKTEWHFCDEVKVIVEGTAKPSVVEPEGPKKKIDHKKYVDVAMKFPASEIQRPPKLDVAATGDAKPADGATPPPAEAKPEEKPAETKPAETPPPAETKAETKPEKKPDEKPKDKEKEKSDLKPED